MSTAWAGGSTTAWRKTRALILARDGYTCRIQLPGCTRKATHCDHIIPRSKGGNDDMTNLRAACRHCNLRRGNTMTNPPPRGGTKW